jgi:hypothetical protein
MTSSEEIRDEVLGKGVEFVTGLSNELNGVSIALPAVSGQRLATDCRCADQFCRSDGAPCSGATADG